MSPNPLAQLGDLSKPATVLIEKISDAVGGVFKPYQIVRVARAEAEAEKIRAEAQIEITDLHRRAMHRFLEEEAKKQSNIETITGAALPLLGENSTPEKVDNDWITNFFDKCRIVSDEDMQKLWSKILASEANSPGAFSRRTVNLMADLGKDDAELFMNLCGFGCKILDFVPLVYDVKNEIYTKYGIHFTSLTHLDALGLVRFDNFRGFSLLRLPRKCPIEYFGTSLELTLSGDPENNLGIGKVMLTQAGEELASICEAKPVDGFLDYLYHRWEKDSLMPKRAS